MLPDHLACSFIGYVTAPSLLPVVDPQFFPVEKSNDYTQHEKRKIMQEEDPPEQQPNRPSADNSLPGYLDNDLLKDSWEVEDITSPILLPTPSLTPRHFPSVGGRRLVIAIDYGTTYTGLSTIDRCKLSRQLTRINRSRVCYSGGRQGEPG
jgi:hypothetical protein